MVSMILSDQFPSVEHCNIYSTDHVHGHPHHGHHGQHDTDTELLVPNCPNVCCTGAFIQEGMMGVVLSAEVRQLLFTSDKVTSRRQFPASLEFNVPVVLTHLLGKITVNKSTTLCN